MSPQPFLSEDAPQQPRPVDPILMAMTESYDAVAAEVANTYDAQYLKQPRDTVADRCMTKRAYCNGAVGLRMQEHDPLVNFSHMNGAYGRAVLDDFFRLAEACEVGA